VNRGAKLVAVALAPLALGVALAAALPGGPARLAIALVAGAALGLVLAWWAMRAPAADRAAAPPAVEVASEVVEARVGAKTAALEARLRERTAELEAARAELEQRSRRGEEGDRLKSLFIANMSHEIRTPLNSVLALSQLLRDGVAGPLTVDQRRYLEVIERNGQNLLRLINDILDLSRIEAGYVEIDAQDLDVGREIAEVIASLGPLAMAKDLELAAKLPDRLPRVRADADRLRQVLTNLVGNAIKFTETGMVQVTAEARDGVVAIAVIDTGVGIPPADLGRIFQEFFQVDQTLARRQGGTGLGLAIASRLARLMDGEISVSSIVGSGSRFTLTLPRAGAERADAAAAPAVEAGARTDAAPALGERHIRPRVLLVEDNEDNLFTLRQVLSRLPLEISTATSGRRAIERFRLDPPDLVILDVQMPGMSGLQATGAIRALPGGADVPIIALTAQAMKGDRERILAAGCDEYVAKPLQPKALIDVVTRLLARSETGDRAPREENPDGAHTPRR
jgi:signal transduction histidine kinase/ActR/RegA family two-component response regulator